MYYHNIQVAQLCANVLAMAELDCRADLKAKDLSGGDVLRHKHNCIYYMFISLKLQPTLTESKFCCRYEVCVFD
jgi:hypothetical protein